MLEPEKKSSITIFLLICITLIVLPFFMQGYWLRVVTSIMMFATITLAINFIAGYAGYAAFGNVVFMGIGAYTTAIFMVKAGIPWWIDGFLIDGMYLATAWVVSVMLPPMAIFFPLFTLLEDFGYLPRVAYNLDRIFKSAGAHGKQALTMSMGFGCNAAGIISTRIIDSPRERLIAIITNNFALCNGR